MANENKGQENAQAVEQIRQFAKTPYHHREVTLPLHRAFSIVFPQAGSMLESKAEGDTLSTCEETLLRVIEGIINPPGSTLFANLLPVADLVKVCQFIPANQTSLSISNVDSVKPPFSEEDWSQLLQALSNTNVTRLLLSHLGIKLTDTIEFDPSPLASSLKELAEKIKIRTLVLNQITLQGTALSEMLVALRSVPSVIELDIDSSNLEGINAEQFAQTLSTGLAKGAFIRRLCFSSTHLNVLGKEGLIQFAKSLKDTSVTELDIAYSLRNNFDLLLSMLKELPPNISYVNLSGNELGGLNEGQLKELLTACPAIHINLSGNDFAWGQEHIVANAIKASGKHVILDNDTFGREVQKDLEIIPPLTEVSEALSTSTLLPQVATDIVMGYYSVCTLEGSVNPPLGAITRAAADVPETKEADDETNSIWDMTKPEPTKPKLEAKNDASLSLDNAPLPVVSSAPNSVFSDGSLKPASSSQPKEQNFTRR